VNVTEPPSRLGATVLDGGRCRFLVWAPYCERVEVHLLGWDERRLPLERDDRGYHAATVEDVPPGTRYLFRLNGDEIRPDPASRFQPEGVHGPSEVVDPGVFEWTDAVWSGRARSELVFYELHVGTFTDEGTFDAVIPLLDGLRELGITAIELMPVNQCPGARNWGYDGVQIFAVQHSYGGPEGLRRLVDACHARGLAVFLDVVYNHFGPEGNYLSEFGPYFTERYRTPWGAAVNFDDRDSDHVRRFFMQNALQWIEEYHVDGFRLDAIHAIADQSPQPFLRLMAQEARELGARLGRRVQVIAESNMNDPRVVNPGELGGLGMDAEWNDDFHHALHAFLTGENTGYYRDYGAFSDIVKALSTGFVYTGRTTTFRGRAHGDVPRLYKGENFVVFAQNHDQVGNRAQGDRLSTMIPYEMQKAVAGFVALSPYLPLFFMGEEYGETAPFQYFVDHSEPYLIDAVREGRRREFRSFRWQGEVPDPAAPATFARSKVGRELLDHSKHRALREFHRELLRLRRQHRALTRLDLAAVEVTPYLAERVIFMRRRNETGDVCCTFSFGRDASVCQVPLPAGSWRLALDSTAECWHGPGSQLPESATSDGECSLVVPAMSCCVYLGEPY
jgi:maltooligosyltrehalose trehalohydrolase